MPLRAPLSARAVSSRFGYRMDPFLGRLALHAGLDLVADAGTPVRATAAGTVVAAGWNVVAVGTDAGWFSKAAAEMKREAVSG